MIDIKVKFTGDKKIQEILYALDNNLLYGQAQRAIPILSHRAAKKMREVISSSKKRPSQGTNLEDNIKSEKINTTGGISYGVGNIDILNKNARYWEVLNNGGYVPPANIGYFGTSFRAPESGGSGEQWNHTGKGSGYFYMKPKKAIEGIRYIEQAANQVELEMTSVMKSIGGDLIKLLSK